MRLPAGTYYIGDPYHIAEEKDGPRWRFRVDSVSDVAWRSRVGHNVKGAGREAAILFDHCLAVIPVNNLAKDDAGEIALKMLPGELTPDKGYMIETFSEPFYCSDKDGIICIGHLTVGAKENPPDRSEQPGSGGFP